MDAKCDGRDQRPKDASHNNGYDINEEMQQKIATQLGGIIQEDEGVEILTEYIWHMAKDPNTSLQFMNDELVEFLDDKAASFSKWLASNVLPFLRPPSSPAPVSAESVSPNVPQEQRSNSRKLHQSANSVSATTDEGDSKEISSAQVSAKSNAEVSSHKKERRSRILGLAVQQAADEQHVESMRDGSHQSSSRGVDGPSRRTGLRPKHNRGSSTRQRSFEDGYTRRSRQVILEDGADGEARRASGGRHDRDRSRDDYRRNNRSDIRHIINRDGGYSADYGEEGTRRIREARHPSRSRSRNVDERAEYPARRRDPRWRDADLYERGQESYFPHSAMDMVDNVSGMGGSDERRYKRDNVDAGNYGYSDMHQPGNCRAVLRPNPNFESSGMEDSLQSVSYDRYDNADSSARPFFNQVASPESVVQHPRLHVSTDHQQANAIHPSNAHPTADVSMTQWQAHQQRQPMTFGPQHAMPERNVWNASTSQLWPHPRPAQQFGNVQQLQQIPQAPPNSEFAYGGAGSSDGFMGTAFPPERISKIKKRCVNYPECKFGDNCRFVHPTEMCQTWPRCPYGMECFFIHPEVPCKYGVHCLNWYCNYKHPANWTPPMANDMFGYFGGVSSPPQMGRGGGQAKFRNKTLHLALQSTNSEELVVEADDVLEQPQEEAAIAAPAVE